ncbi:hypothetical protein ALQ60_04884 [Pseudomonas syringae pv. papulans]|nr:hypothetical protein ALQ60_04884 [Pseudomonas syringae pv. papulans]
MAQGYHLLFAAAISLCQARSSDTSHGCVHRLSDYQVLNLTNGGAHDRHPARQQQRKQQRSGFRREVAGRQRPADRPYRACKDSCDRKRQQG